MFENIGGKIKAWAKVVCWIGIIASVVSGIIVITGATTREDIGIYTTYYKDVTNWSVVWTGIMIILFGSIGSGIASDVLYGFGELIVENKQLLKENNRLLGKIMEKDNKLLGKAVENKVLLEKNNRLLEKIAEEEPSLPATASDNVSMEDESIDSASESKNVI